jgi:hypothetical protein
LAGAQDELSDVRDQVASLEHSHKLISVEAANFKAAAKKAECLLSSRTERFVEYRARKDAEIKTIKSTAKKKYNKLMQSKEEEICRLKAAAESRVSLLEKCHWLEIRKAQPKIYTKEIIQYQKKVEALEKSNK